MSDTLIDAASSLVEDVTITHGIPVDFDGLRLAVLRHPITRSLQAVIIIPVDMRDGMPVERYKP